MAIEFKKTEQAIKALGLNIKFAKMDATTEEVQQMHHIEEFPHIVVYQ